MKIISKKYWHDIKKFLEQISLKFKGIYLIKMNLAQTVL